MMDIVQIDKPFLGVTWPSIGPHLLAGAIHADEGGIEEAIDDVFEDKARVWAIVEDGDVHAAFLTSVVEADAGHRYLDVYGLGGRNMMKWGRQLSERMAEYARLNECSKVIFKGRKALLRTYTNVKMVGEEAPGLYVFERAV